MNTKIKEFSIKSIDKQYHKSKIFNNLSIDFMQLGNIIGIVGPNGAGKSTLFKILSGLANPNKGSIKTNLEISKLIENPGFIWSKSGLYNLKYLLDKEEFKSAQEFIKLFEMEEYINRWTWKYSLGMKQKLALVIVLSKKSDVILLDEPTLSLDSESITKLIDIVKDLSKTKKILVSTHDTPSWSHVFSNILHVKNKNLTEIINSSINSTSFIINVKKYNDFINNFKVAVFQMGSNKDFIVTIDNNKIDDVIREITYYGLIKLVPVRNEYGE